MHETFHIKTTRFWPLARYHIAISSFALSPLSPQVDYKICCCFFLISFFSRGFASEWINVLVWAVMLSMTSFSFFFFSRITKCPGFFVSMGNFSVFRALLRSRSIEMTFFVDERICFFFYRIWKPRVIYDSQIKLKYSTSFSTHFIILGDIYRKRSQSRFLAYRRLSVCDIPHSSLNWM